jgi:hypothetical protein
MKPQNCGHVREGLKRSGGPTNDEKIQALRCPKTEVFSRLVARPETVIAAMLTNLIYAASEIHREDPRPDSRSV